MFTEALAEDKRSTDECGLVGRRGFESRHSPSQGAVKPEGEQTYKRSSYREIGNLLKGQTKALGCFCKHNPNIKQGAKNERI